MEGAWEPSLVTWSEESTSFPLQNLITRRLCWLTRIGQEYFEGLEHCQPCTVEQPEEEELEEPEPEEEETVPTETTGLRAFLVANGMPMEPL